MVIAGFLHRQNSQLLWRRLALIYNRYVAIELFYSEVDFWSEIGPDSTNVDFLVDPFDQDRILHYLAYFGLDVEILIEDLQQEIDNEDSTSLREVKRLKRQNTLFSKISETNMEPSWKEYLKSTSTMLDLFEIS